MGWEEGPALFVCHDFQPGPTFPPECQRVNVLKIQICLPMYNEIHPGCVRGVRDCLQASAKLGIDFHVNMIQSSNITHARNFLLNDGKSQSSKQEPIPGYDYFLFVDSDMGFSVEDVAQLLSLRTPVASGLYLEKGTGKSLAGFWERDDFENPIFGVKGDTLAEGIKGTTEVDWVGAGFLLIARAVLCELTYPWFHQNTINGPEGVRLIGEDFGFCLRCNEAGIPIVVDCDVKLDHYPTRLTDYFDAMKYFSRIKLGRPVSAPMAGW
jgi:hypothetical protein